MSRIPLRDSLHRLEAEGLVRIDGRRGARVATLSPSDVEEIYDLRLLLEPEAARRALAAIDDATAAQLVRLSQEMDRDADDALAGYRARRRFYAELYGHCGNPRLATTVMRLRDEVSHYHLLAAGESARAHREFRRCIQRRDCDGAADVLGRHLARARDDLLASLKTAAETAG